MNKRLKCLFFMFLVVLILAGCGKRETEKIKETEYVDTGQIGFTEDVNQIDEALQSVLKITTYEDDGDVIATGSGVVVFESNVVVTCCHVIVNMEYMILEDEQGNNYRLKQEDVIAENVDLDIAVCRIPQKVEIQPLSYSKTAVKRGEKVLAIGSQFGILNMVTTGIISGTFESDGNRTILFTAPIASGSSGGAVFNDSGEVIGIIMGTYDSSQNFNLAIPIEEAEKIYISYVK